MHSFTDNAGREWKLSLSLGAEARVYAETKVYLSDISNTSDAEGGDLNVFDRLMSDPGFLGSVIWVLCEKQGTQAGITQEDFVDAIDSSVVEASRDALIEEILDFLGRQGQAIRQVRAERTRLAEEIERENLKALQGLDGAGVLHLLERLIVPGTFTDTDGNAEVSAELTLESLQSASSTS